jgi:predicted phage baseplate assembly protein
MVLLEVPPRHEFGDVGAAGGAGAAWLRCRSEGQRAPRNISAATTVAATAPVVHARPVADEPLGVSDGSAGQRFRLRELPVIVDGLDPVVEVGIRDAWTAWTPVADFAKGTPTSRHVVIDWAAGEIRFPPAVREPDGPVRRYGAVPPAGALVRVRGYWVGGGVSGNVAQGALRILRSPVPGVRARVENPYPARGGCDAETEQELWHRAPFALRSGGRAVTAADHEELAHQAHPGVARAHCVDTPGGVRLLIVPQPKPGHELHPSLDDLRPPTAMLTAVRDHLEPRRLLGVRLSVEPPSYQGISVAARIVTGGDVRTVRSAAIDAVSRLLHPVIGGDGGDGWEFGEPVTVPAIRKLLFGIAGVLDVDDVALHPVDLATGARSPAQQTIPLIETALPVPSEHEIEVVRSN